MSGDISRHAASAVQHLQEKLPILTFSEEAWRHHQTPPMEYFPALPDLIFSGAVSAWWRDVIMDKYSNIQWRGGSINNLHPAADYADVQPPDHYY